MTRLIARQSAAAARLRDALHSPALDDRTDADLLDRFACYGEHPAFEVLLRRHGPMVFGVCRRVLANTADAEDAFQATFLVLVRKASSVRRGERLGPWLYGVAFRVASKARGRAARVASRHTEATDMLPDPSAPAEVPDWLPVLDAELHALPAKYREPLVLCELQGATRAEAAKALGVPEGTLSSRLARARELLRKRLLKHGTLLPAGGLAALFAAHGTGRAGVPAGLLVRTAELAQLVANGTVPAGAVPAGAARLTDEVLKGMMLTKLRLLGGAVLSLVLMTAGALAAWPGGEPAPPEKAKAGAKAGAPKPTAPTTPPGKAVPDRDALQGLWVLEKLDTTKGVGPDAQRELKAMIGKTRFLIAGDVWWGLLDGPGGNIFPQVARLDPSKNPKWVDFRSVEPQAVELSRGVYELTGDRLRLCLTDGRGGARPAEFNADDDTEVMLMEFRRDKPPAGAGEPALVGSWVGMPTSTRTPDGVEHVYVPRVEILDGHLFAFVQPPSHAGGTWIGGRYTVDATKNPRWIDLELSCPFQDDKVTRLHGSYDIVNGRLKLAIGESGKRVLRPLALEPAADVMFLDVKPTTAPLAPAERVVRDVAPAPKPKAKATDEDADVRQLMKEGDFAAAEDLLRVRLAQSAGLPAAERRIQLGVCLTERGKKGDPKDARTPWSQAAANFSLALKELADEKQPDEKRAAWVRTQAGLRTLQLHQLAGRPDDLLAAAAVFVREHGGTVEELIALSLLYHAQKQKGETGTAAKTRDVMKGVFERLPASAFAAENGEYSRDYWEKTWFAEGK